MSRCIKWFSKTNYYSVQLRGKKSFLLGAICFVLFCLCRNIRKFECETDCTFSAKSKQIRCMHRIKYHVCYIYSLRIAFASRLPRTQKLFHLQIHNLHAHLRVTPKFHGKKSKIIVFLIAFCISLCEYAAVQTK